MRKSTNLKPVKEFIGDVADPSFVHDVFQTVKPEFVPPLTLPSGGMVDGRLILQQNENHSGRGFWGEATWKVEIYEEDQ